MQGRVLVIAGSDSGGGAGIQADIKTVTALGGYAMTAITVLTAQDTRGVTAIHDVPPTSSPPKRASCSQTSAPIASRSACCIRRT